MDNSEDMSQTNKSKTVIEISQPKKVTMLQNPQNPQKPQNPMFKKFHSKNSLYKVLNKKSAKNTKSFPNDDADAKKLQKVLDRKNAKKARMMEINNKKKGISSEKKKSIGRKNKRSKFSVEGEYQSTGYGNMSW
jgi:uncharacterized protein YkwD